MIRYRDATAGDAAAVAAVFAEGFTATFGHLYHADDLAAFLAGCDERGFAGELADPAYRIRLAEADGRVVGFAKMGPAKLPVERRGPSAELWQLYVLKPWQGEGVAATLMDWAIATAREEGARDMFLSVFIENERAKRFYARYGFERIGTYAFPVGNHVDEDDLMRLAL